jgi:PUB domain/Ubiquitin family
MANSNITIQLTVTASQGAPRIPLEISTSITASELRDESSKVTKIPLSSLKLIFRGRMITDDPTKHAVTEFNIEEGSVLHCIGKPAENSIQPPAITSVPSTIPTVSVASTNTATTAPPPVSTDVGADRLVFALQALRSTNPPATYQTAVTTLDKILSNIVDNPMDEKYRKVKKQNPAFQRRLGGVNGGDAVMTAVGFSSVTVDGEDVYLLKANADAWPMVVANRVTVGSAVRDSKVLTNQTSTTTQLARGATTGLEHTNGGDSAGIMSSLSSGDPMAQLQMNGADIQTMMQVSFNIHVTSNPCTNVLFNIFYCTSTSKTRIP